MNSKMKENKKSAIINGIFGGLGFISTAVLTIVVIKVKDSIEDETANGIFKIMAGGLIATQAVNAIASTTEMVYDIKNYKMNKDIYDRFVNKKEAK